MSKYVRLQNKQQIQTTELIFFLFLFFRLMLIKTLPLFKSSRLCYSSTLNNFLKEPSNNGLDVSQNFSKNKISKMPGNSKSLQQIMVGSQISYSFSYSMMPNSLKEGKVPAFQEESSQLIQMSENLKNQILSTAAINEQRISQCIQQKVEKDLEKNLKVLLRGKFTEQEQINLKVLQKTRIEASFLQNEELIRQIEFNENYRAMIMIRLHILWNQNYEQLSIDQLIHLTNDLENCKQLKNNELKSMAVIFLAVETLKKCILSPRINKNMFCTTKSLFENLTSVQRSLRGEMQARSNLQKVQNLLSSLLLSIEQNSNRYCFMKVQSQLHFLISEIFKSFHESDLYNDKEKCLLSNPPRVIFDEPFHQEYDRFIQMAVLVLFDKRLKKEGKLNKLQNITHIFERLKSYQEGKLKQTSEKESSCMMQIKKLKKKITKMDKRVGIIQWIQEYVGKSTSK